MAKRTTTTKTTPKTAAPKKTVAKKSPKPRTKKAPAKVEAPLIVSISGIRGIAGLSLTHATMLPYLEAFLSLCKGKRMILGYDARPSTMWISQFVQSILVSKGFDVVLVGLAPTPSVGFLVRKLKAAGGICITASHNPTEYNGLKFFHSAGEFLTAEMLVKIKKLAEKPIEVTEVPKPGTVKEVPESLDLHLQALISAVPPPERKRASKAPKVIIDTCNNSGAVLAPDVADSYGAVFQMINSDMTKFSFPRGAEPIAENIGQLRRAVVKEAADLGFATDPDADRLALVDEQGLAIGEERTLVLATDAYFSYVSKRKSPVVVNLATSMAMEDVVKKHGVKLYRTAIGEANVLAGIKKYKAAIGGEGNGGVIFPKVQPGRDTASAIALILIGLQARGGTLSEWNATFPNYAMAKEKVPLGSLSVSAALAKVKKAYKGEKIDETDGIKVTMKGCWIQVRASNTEPIVRVTAEAATEKEAQTLLLQVMTLLK